MQDMMLAHFFDEAITGDFDFRKWTFGGPKKRNGRESP